ncbi:MAG: OmpA family protein [Nannocystaceae bacterium]
MTLTKSLLGTLSVSLALLALSATGCKKPEYPACKKDKHCEEGETCVEGLCQNCTTDEDCVGKGENGEDLTCVEFRCDVSEAGAGAPGELGSPCTSSDDCTGGWVCRDGVCGACASAEDCGGGACNLDSGRCESACSTDDDCPMDEICDGGQCIFSGDYGDSSDEVLCNLEAIFFAFDSPKLTPSTEEALQAAASCIAEQGRNVILEAHADNVGTTEYNIALSQRRGDGVKTYLKDLGVPEESMSVNPKGDLESMGQTEADRAKDRRVELIWQ